MSTTSQEMLTPLQRFWRLLNVDRKEIGHIYVYAIFNGLINLSLPVGIQAIIGLIQGGKVSASWIVLVAFVIGGIALTGFLQMRQLKITENLQRNIFTRASFEFAYRIPRIRQKVLNSVYAPEMVNRFFDTLSVQKGLSKILMDFSTSSFQVLFGLILLSIYHPFFILFSLVLILLVFVIFRFTSDRGLRASIRESHAKYQVAHWLEELARAMGTFKMAGNSELPLKRVDGYTSDYLDSRASHFRVLYNQYGFLVVFKVIVAAGLLIAGSILVFKQQMNIGQFVAAEILILLIIASVEKLILSLDVIYDVLTSLEKIGQVTDLPLERQEGERLNEICKERPLNIELEDIGFSYPGSVSPVLDAVSMNIKEGQKIMLTGPSGSGKTTLLQLIAGFYPPKKGRIFFNDVLMSQLQMDSVRQLIGDYTHEQVLFRGTIRDNIAMGKPGVTSEDVKWAIEQVGLASYLRGLSEGLEAEIFPEGKRLPRGIIQKILLARCIVDRPKLILLEDEMHALTAKEKEKVMNFLTAPDAPWALLIASQDLRWAERVEEVVIMENGKFKARGSYEKLKKEEQFNEPE